MHPRESQKLGTSGDVDVSDQAPSFGKDVNIHIANTLGQDAYCMVSANPTWVIADFVIDAAALLVPAGELKAAVGTVETIKTVQDLYKAFKVIKGLTNVSQKGAKAIADLVAGFKKNAIRIPSGDYKNIYHKDAWKMVMKPSGVAGLTGAKTVCLTIIIGDGKTRHVHFNTNPDKSWILEEGRVVRSKYGTIWQPQTDPKKVSKKEYCRHWDE